MTTLTFKSLESGQSKILVFRKVEKLKKILNIIYFDKETKKFYYVEKRGKKEETFEFIGASFDQNDESIKLLRRKGLIPKKEEYSGEVPYEDD